MSEKFKQKYKVSFSDMDINYRLTKIAAVKFFQETFALYCAKHGLAAFDVIKDNLVWVISDLKIEFTDTLPYWSESFEVEMWISEKTALRTYIDCRIYYKNKVIAQGDCCFYLIDLESRRPVKSADTLKAFETVDEKVFAGQDKVKYLFDGEKIAEKEHEVTVRDLDFNFHVNNLSYMGIALETAPADMLEQYAVEGYSIKFVREAVLGDILDCELFKNNNLITARIYNKNNNADVCFIKANIGVKTDFGRNPREAGVVFE